jgi:3-phenylpropionate/trans-cinnamate dioxygenase ferredoxin reductase subunit
VLRTEGFRGRILLVGEERQPPYERPALSKGLLTGERSPESLGLRPSGHWQELGIEHLPGTRVESVDVRGRTATTSTGSVLRWQSLVVATGAGARTLPAPPTGVHLLRTLDDALALAAALRPGRRVAVVGAGFVGGEVATSAAALGADVTVVDSGRFPLERALGPEAGQLLARSYADQGIALRPGAVVESFRSGPANRLRGVLLADGSEVPCDVAVLGIGAVPVSPAGVFAAAGILTDACGRTRFPDVYACGDVALSFRRSAGRPMRVEHWSNASGQGAAVARAILGRPEPYSEPPYFWSDQLGLRLQFVGHADRCARVEVEGDHRSFRIEYFDGDRRLQGALLVNRPGEVSVVRRQLAA